MVHEVEDDPVELFGCFHVHHVADVGDHDLAGVLDLVAESLGDGTDIGNVVLAYDDLDGAG